MNELLSWTSLPNLHPAVVHFPIAILPVAILFEFAGLVRSKQDWLAHVATCLYALAALGAGLAVWAGRRAADSLVDVPAAAQQAIGAHSDAAHNTAYFLGALGAC